MTRFPLVLVFGAVLLIATCVKARSEPPRLPAGVTCEQVRAMVAEHGRIYAYAWARLQGYTAAQISEAKRCLK